MWSFYKTRSFYKGFLIYQKLFFNVFAIIFLCFKEILELEAVLNIRGSPLGLGMVFLMQVELQNLMNNNNKKLESNLIRNRNNNNSYWFSHYCSKLQNWNYPVGFFFSDLELT